MKAIERKIQKKIEGDRVLLLISQTAQQHGIYLYIVGGFVRDALLKSDNRDIDFVITRGNLSFYKKIEERLGHRVITFRKKGVVNRRVTVDGRVFDFVDASKKGIERELSRRDFTINSIAYSLRGKKIVDPQNGIPDLREKVIKRNSRSVFRNDPLRMIRAIRLTCEKEAFTIEGNTFHQIKSSPEAIRRVSGERIKEELDRIMATSFSSKGIALLYETGLLKNIIPELAPLEKCPKGKRHSLDPWHHTVRALYFADHHERLCADLGIIYPLLREDLLLFKYALLFHDIAKPQTFSEDEKGDIHFFHHEQVSSTVASRIMKRLRFPGKLADDVRKLIELHLRPHLLAETSPSDKALARLIVESKELTELLAIVALADGMATAESDDSPRITELRKLLARLLEMHRGRAQKPDISSKLVSGEDVMKILGLSQGPRIGNILKKIEELRISGELNSRTEALHYLSTLALNK
ncbi:MAG: HD domain-containing protein [Acidobacteriota bacterium]